MTIAIPVHILTTSPWTFAFRHTWADTLARAFTPADLRLMLQELLWAARWDDRRSEHTTPWLAETIQRLLFECDALMFGQCSEDHDEETVRAEVRPKIEQALQTLNWLSEHASRFAEADMEAPHVARK